MPDYVLRLIAYYNCMERFLGENEIAIEEETDAEESSNNGAKFTSYNFERRTR